MTDRIIKRFFALILSAILIMGLIPQSVLAEAAGRVDPPAPVRTALSGHGVEGLSASYDAGTWSVTGVGAIRGTVKASKDSCDNYNAVTGTLTLTNNFNAKVSISMSWSVDPTYGTLKIGGTTMSGTSGTRAVEVAAGGSTTVAITASGNANGYNTGVGVRLTNITLEVVPVNATVTFVPGEHGSFTLDGSAVTSSVTRTQLSTIPYELEAFPDSGYAFYGWIDTTNSNRCISADNPASLNIDSNITLQPKFIPAGNALFMVGSTYYTDLNAANTAAASASTKQIVLVNSGTLASGSYTISSGVTLLIPYNAAHTLVTSIKTSSERTYSTPREFRCLTLANGAAITVSGSISVAAEAFSMSGGGQTVGGGVIGPYGRIDMLGGSSITLNSGAYLYAYGYVTGDGAITAKSGSTVKECFQITEFRGGTALSGMNNNSQKVFPMSQYYVQNIEAPVTFQYGSSEKLDSTLFADGQINDVNDIAFIGSSGALFNMSSGASATKRYDPHEDRLAIDINGSVSLSAISINLIVTLSSSKYVLPINSNIDINIHSGTTTITNSTELLPGARVTVDEGATVNINSGVNLFVYDSTEWCKATNGYDKYFGYLNDLMPLPYTPTRAYTRTSADLKDTHIDVNGTVNVTGKLITTAGGADITSSRGTGKIVMNSTGTATLYQASQSGSDVSYHQISVTSAQFKNGDGYAGTDDAYVKTAQTGTGTYFYSTNAEKWYKFKVDYVYNGTTVYTDYIAGNTSTYSAGGMSFTGASATNGSASVSGGNVTVTGVTANSTVTLSGTAAQFVPVFVLDETNAALYRTFTGSELTETVAIEGETFYVVRRDQASAFGSALSAPQDSAMGVTEANHNSIAWKLENNASSLCFTGTVPAGASAGGEVYIYGIYSGSVASLTYGGATRYYPTLIEAFNAAPGSGESVITLLADCGSFKEESPLQGYSVLEGARLTVDLNGHRAAGHIMNKGALTLDLNGGAWEYYTGAAEASTAYRAASALWNNGGDMTVRDTAGGGVIITDAAEDNSSLTNYTSVIRNTAGGTLRVYDAELVITQDINAYGAVILNHSSKIPELNGATLRSNRGYGVWNYGGTIGAVDGCEFATAYGINNRNIRGNSYTFSGGASVTAVGSIALIKDSLFNVGQYAIYNGGVITELRGSTFIAHPDSAQVNTVGTADTNVQGNVQCYTVFNSNVWWYDTSLWRRTDTTSAPYTRTDEYKEDDSCRPTIGRIESCTIIAENTSTSADHGCALYNNGGVIGVICGDTVIKTYKHPDNAKSIASNYALRNTAGGVIRSIEGSVEISATGYSAVYIDAQFTAKTVNTYGDKAGGSIQLHNMTTYGAPSEITSITASGVISAGSYYGIYTNGYIGAIDSADLTISANYNALLNSGAGALASYEYIRTYTNNADASTETKRVEIYVRNLEKGGVIGSIKGVHLVGTGTNSYQLLQNQGYIGSIKDSDLTAASPRAGESYPMVLNGDSRQAGYTLTREPFAYEALFITPYMYHYDYATAEIGEMDNVTITKNATFALRNLGVIGTIKNSSITGTQYVLVNATTGPYTERDHVRYYSGAAKFSTTKNNGSDLVYHYKRVAAEIGSIENSSVTGTSTYTLYNGGHIGPIEGTSFTSTNTTVFYNGGSSVREYDYNLFDIITVTATDSACTVSYGLGDETKIIVTDYDAPVIDLIGAGCSISGTYQVVANLGVIGAIDGGSEPVVITSATQKQVGGIYSYNGTLDSRTATTPYTAGTAGTTVNTDAYLSAHIGSIRNAVITANGIGIQNGANNAAYLPVIDELCEGLEVNANCTSGGYHAVYNTANAKIAAITGGVYTAATATTNAYRNNNTDPSCATLISGGDFKGMASARANAIFDPDNTSRQTYPAGKDLVGPRTAALHDGSSSDGYYFIGSAYTVTWANWDGTVLETDSGVPEGASPSYDGGTPARPDDGTYTYTFAGWAAEPGQETGVPASELPAVTGDATYYAAFSKALKGYTVTWLNWDGTQLEKDENVPAGADPSYDGPTPERQGDAQYSYTFTGWSPEITPVTGDVTYTAVFEGTLNTFTVTFVDWQGGVIAQQQVEYGGAATAPAAPERTGYNFTGWDKDFTNVTGDLTVTAQYAPVTHTLTVSYVYYQNGQAAAETVTLTLGYGETYSVASPGIANYAADIAAVEGTMGLEDITVTVTYYSSLNGDVNCDGKVDFEDVTMLSAFTVGSCTLTAQGILNGDADGSGVTDAVDISYLYNRLLNN
ncbi:MAG: InlB B-repeat-containing protein [Clostridia bacterium]|nr:InlB B-repeat-containing protein [Clostridia bacterium]